jgi:uncharacterized delta-60 repeat protein
MKKPQKSEVISRIVKGVVKGIGPTTAVASGLLSTPSWGAPGDLDPTFGDMGRASFPQTGAAFHVQELISGDSLIAGGEERDFGHCGYYDYFCPHVSGFMGQVSPTGSLDLELASALLAGTEVIDFALQPDGKIVAVGQIITAKRSVLTVFRLVPGGLLDPNFANKGVMHYAPGTKASSVVLDPSGAIVVAGSNGSKLMVLRLLGSGSLDGSFGQGGVYVGPSDFDERIHIVRTASGGYRVSARLANVPRAGDASCGVVALTAAGVVDTTFGEAGIAAIPPHEAGAEIHCQAMTAQPDGSLVLGGEEGGHGFVTRLLAGGALDPGFAAGAVQSNMAEATALAVDPAGSILVAGAPNPGVPGALILRLHAATGLLDELFGSGGTTWIDLPSSQATGPTLQDLSVLADGRVLAAGSAWSTNGGQQPLLVRLVGVTETAGAGVIGVMQSPVAVKEQDKSAVVTVRRMGGATGSVSVSYRTADYTGTDAPLATSGTDYTPVTGQLTWADGDRSDRQIAIPILTDGRVEEPKRFTVTLDGASAGAKIGTQEAAVEVATDGDRAGELGIAAPANAANAGDGSVQIAVNRNYYSTGPISVTLTPVPGSATSADFSATPLTLSWADGDSGQKTATIPIVTANIVGSPKSFTVKLTNPTNGAVIGPQAHEFVTISAKSTPPQPQPQPQPTDGGGGAFDWFALLCLGCVRWLRRRAFPKATADNTN